MRKIFICLILIVPLFSENLLIENFECDLYSKIGNHAIKKLTTTIEVIGKDLNANRSKLFDSLNIIISSYFIEDILTSKGKENFKDMFVKYAKKRHNLDISAVFILEMKTLNQPNIDEIVKAIRETGICDDKKGINAQNREKVNILPKSTVIDLGGYDYTKDPNFGKDFGE